MLSGVPLGSSKVYGQPQSHQLSAVLSLGRCDAVRYA